MKKAERHCESLSPDIAKVSMDDLEILVPQHSFWQRFAAGWEPDTERIYRQTVKEGSVVLDVGAWIGPTLLFALYCGASRIVALEPNPKSYASLQRFIELNPGIEDRVTLINRALHPDSGKITMGQVEGESDSSMFGIGGSDVEVDTISLDSVISEYALSDIDLIKIDIEGAEALLVDELKTLSHRKGQVLHLSIHVPMFPEGSDVSRMAEVLSAFDVADDRGEPLSAAELRSRLLSTERYPVWGTQHGNFFELLLVARQ